MLKYLLLAIVVVLVFVITVVRYRKKNSYRQSSFGDKDAYKAVQTPTNYQPLKILLAKADTFNKRYFYTVCAAHGYPLETLEQWVNDEPESADALLCHGARLVRAAWEARGYGLAKGVTEERAMSHAELLSISKEVLLKCTDMQSNDPTPWAYLINVSTWGGQGPQGAQVFFDEAIKRDPYSWAAHMHMVIALAEKWGGNNDEMVAFAENASRKAPLGNDLAVLPIKAYIENWKDLKYFKQKPEYAKQYLLSEEFRSKAIDAYDRSIGAAAHKDTAVSVFVRYNTSAWFCHTMDTSRLKKDLKYLGDAIVDIHWRWAGTEGQRLESKLFSRSG